MTLTFHLQNANRRMLISGCKMGILFFLAIYISQIPFPKGNASVKSISLSLVGLLWLARMVLERRFSFQPTRLWWPLIIFTLITLLSVVGSIDVGYSVENLKKYTLISVFLFFAIVNNVEEMQHVKTLLLALMVSTGFFSVLAMIHYFITEPSFGSRLRFPYFYTNVNRFSKFFDVVIPINLVLIFITQDQTKKLLYGFVLILSVSTLFFMQTRGSYVVVFLSLLAVTFVYFKRLFLVLIILPLLIGSVAPGKMVPRLKEMFRFEQYLKSDGILNYRMDAWKGALKIISEHPLMGLGVGKSNFGKTAREFDDLHVIYDHAHNTYLQIAVELGLVGLAVFLWLFGSVFYYGFKFYISLPRNDEKTILIFGILCGAGALFSHGLIAHFYKHESYYMLWVTVALLFALIEGDVGKSHFNCAPTLRRRQPVEQKAL